RVKEDNGLAMRADLRLAGARDGDTFTVHLLAGGVDIFHLDADVMNATLRILGEEAGDGRVFAEWLQQFDLGVAEIDEDGGHAVVRLRHGFRDLRIEFLAVGLRGRLDVRNGDGNVIERS